VIDPESVDPGSVDWPQVAQSAYLIHQRVTYEYPTPIQDLQHKLVVLPPLNHGDQRRVAYQLEVSSAEHEMTTRRDAFGNLVVDLSAPWVERSIQFQAWTIVERRAATGPHRVGGRLLRDRRLLGPSPLTQPDDALRAAAADLLATGEAPLALAARISTWVHGAMTYEKGVTEVKTTAAEALALGRGVCQDYAHVMIAVCRLCGIPARYVSGHLLGEGAMHAWVEVMLPSEEHPGEGAAWPFDPTHDRATSLSYLTVAVGRDYADVSPTRGTFRAPTPGTLSSQRSVSLTTVQYGLFSPGWPDVA
jgi:transglutaminase-like putative cysteine protease